MHPWIMLNHGKLVTFPRGCHSMYVSSDPQQINNAKSYNNFYEDQRHWQCGQRRIPAYCISFYCVNFSLSHTYLGKPASFFITMAVFSFSFPFFVFSPSSSPLLLYHPLPLNTNSVNIFNFVGQSR